MYSILVYKDRQGRESITEYIKELERKAITSKDARIRLKKITEYLSMLKHYGTRIGQPFVKHIGGNLWELRPTNNRVFFFYWQDDKFVLLHHYIKKSKKTPPKEMEQARRNLKDFLERSK